VIGAVVVTYNAPVATVGACLAALLAAGGVDACVLVDTGGRAAMRTTLDPRVEYMTMANRGYGAAVNAGCRRLLELGADTIAVLNDDIVVRAGWVQELASALTDRVGVAQPVLVDGSSGCDVVSSLGVEFDRYGAGVDRGRGAPLPEPGHTVPVDVFTGGAFAMTAAFVASTGGFDERWFLYYEDADLALRGRALGWQYRLVTGAVVVHAGGVSTSVDPDRTRYLQERNRLWFAARHLDARTVVRAVSLSIRRLRHEPRRAHRRALAAGLAGVPARLRDRWRGRAALNGAAGG
jgi:GT2 family glycosyltransferase